MPEPTSDLPCSLGRRGFLLTLGGQLLAILPFRNRWPTIASTQPAPRDHPTPRPGITAEKVLPADKLNGDQNVIEAFDQVREIPQIVDGIRCHCGCADQPSHYSLLSCFEDGMAIGCPICKGQGRMAYRLNKAGKTLDEIRDSIDARYG